MSMNFALARHTMIEQQIRPWDVLDPRVLAVLAAVRREDFVPEAQRTLAFADLPLPLAHGEYMMKPVHEGRLLQALAIAPSDCVLEIGTGSGYLTACLAKLSHETVSIDIHNDFLTAARRCFDIAEIGNVRLECADALTWHCDRQFDVIAVTGAVAEIPTAFLQWLAPGGRLFVVRGHSPVQEAVVMTRSGDDFKTTSLFETDILYLRGTAPTAHFTL